MFMQSSAAGNIGRDITLTNEITQNLRVLVVDDEPGMRNFLVRTLASCCKCVEEATDSSSASRLLERAHFDLIILDNILKGKRGLEWLREQRREGFFGDVILVTAFADLETAIEAMRAGATDFVLKPFRTNQILTAMGRCLDRTRLMRENVILRRELRVRPGGDPSTSKLIGESHAIQEVRSIISRLAPLSTTVLSSGESGTGKEVAARELHALSDRAKGPFVPVNCGAIAPEIFESELFGHVKGAFTGATTAREGLFFFAQGGTIFLDEIAELPAAMQSKLLRVIEDKRVRPVGAEREIPVDVRLLSATNVDLAVAVDAGQFRQDLYYRLNVMNIHLPPLRDRGRDITALAQMFMQDISLELGVPPLPFDDRTLAEIGGYPWPGNVRELRNFIERALILGKFPTDIAGFGVEPKEEPSDSLDAVEKRHILAVLEAAGGNRAEAARRLGVSRKTLDRKCALWNG